MNEKEKIQKIIKVMKEYAQEKGITEFYRDIVEPVLGSRGNYELQREHFGDINEENYRYIYNGSMRQEIDLKKKMIPYNEYKDLNAVINGFYRDGLNKISDYPLLIEKILEKNPSLLGRDKQEEKSIYYKLLKENPAFKKLKNKFFKHVDDDLTQPIKIQELKSSSYEIDFENFYQALKKPLSPSQFAIEFEIFFKYVSPEVHLGATKLLKDKNSTSFKFMVIDYENKEEVDNYMQNLPEIFSQIQVQIKLEKVEGKINPTDRREESKLKKSITSGFEKVKMEFILQEKKSTPIIKKI